MNTPARRQHCTALIRTENKALQVPYEEQQHSQRLVPVGHCHSLPSPQRSCILGEHLPVHLHTRAHLEQHMLQRFKRLHRAAECRAQLAPDQEPRRLHHHPHEPLLRQSSPCTDQTPHMSLPITRTGQPLAGLQHPYADFAALLQLGTIVTCPPVLASGIDSSSGGAKCKDARESRNQVRLWK